MIQGEKGPKNKTDVEGNQEPRILALRTCDGALIGLSLIGSHASRSSVAKKPLLLTQILLKNEFKAIAWEVTSNKHRKYESRLIKCDAIVQNLFLLLIE